MGRRALATLILVLPMLALATPAQAQACEGSLCAVKRMSDHLLGWFNSLTTQVDAIADAEDRRRLLAELALLNKDLYDLERNTDFLLISLQRPALIEPEVRRALTDTRTSLQRVQERIREAGLLLRQELRAGGVSAEREIANVIQARAIWLSDLETLVASRRPIPQTVIQEGRRVLASLGTSSVALVEVMEKLQPD